MFLLRCIHAIRELHLPSLAAYSLSPPPNKSPSSVRYFESPVIFVSIITIQARLKMSAVAAMDLLQIAILGTGIFTRMQYIPRLREITDSAVIEAIWSRSEEFARAATELARHFAPQVECKWGEAGLEDIIPGSIISGVAVLSGQAQVDTSLKMLRAGKHIIQKKLPAPSTSVAKVALSSYNFSSNHFPYQPIWAVVENYCFEPAFVESKKLINGTGDTMNIQVIVVEDQ